MGGTKKGEVGRIPPGPRRRWDDASCSRCGRQRPGDYAAALEKMDLTLAASDLETLDKPLIEMSFQPPTPFSVTNQGAVLQKGFAVAGVE